jgi:hypothetical protein
MHSNKVMTLLDFTMENSTLLELDSVPNDSY